MKDKFYKAEENMKSAFDNYQAPLDDKAFETFTNSLDKPKSTSGFWLGSLFKSISTYRFGFMALILVSAMFLYRLGTSNDVIGTQEVSSIDQIESNIPDTGNNPILAEASNEKESMSKERQRLQSQDPVDNASGIRTSISEKKELATTKISQNNKQSSQVPIAINTNSAETFENQTFSKTNVITDVLTENMSVNTDVYGVGRRDKESVNKYVNADSDANSVTNKSETITLQTNSSIAKSRTALEELTGINGIEVNELRSERVVPKVGEVIINPWKEKYNRHFYVGLDGGVARELNHATVDNYFQKLSFLEIESLGYHVRVKGGYQFSRYTAIELNVHMKDNYLEWDLSNGLYNPYDTKVQNIPIVGLRLLNTIPIGRSLEFNSSIGYAMGFNLPYFEFFSPGFVIESGLNQTEQLLVTYEYKGTNSSSYNLLEAGIGTSYHITDQMSLTGSLNCFFGSETILSNRIEYIAGEGNPGDFEITSKGGFYSIDLGLVFRFRDSKD